MCETVGIPSELRRNCVDTTGVSRPVTKELVFNCFRCVCLFVVFLLCFVVFALFVVVCCCFVVFVFVFVFLFGVLSHSLNLPEEKL